jgi:hypothetical protein
MMNRSQLFSLDMISYLTVSTVVSHVGDELLLTVSIVVVRVDDVLLPAFFIAVFHVDDGAGALPDHHCARGAR